MAQEEIKIGDFVQAIWVGDDETIKEGVVIRIDNDEKRVAVKGWSFESLCISPQKIKESKLTAKQRDLKVWAQNQIL